MANTKSIGEISEAVVMTEFIKAGFPVLLPFGDNQRYDMVVEAFLQLPARPDGEMTPVHQEPATRLTADSELSAGRIAR